MKPAITDEHRRRADLVRRALADVTPHCEVRVQINGDHVVNVYPAAPTPLTDEFKGYAVKATLLARMATDGPEHLTTCPAHRIFSRPDLWSACRKVSVASALLGRTCGAA